MTVKRLQAKCLCGGIRIDADFETTKVGVCHCDVCRRWAGGPFMALEGAQNVVLAGTDFLSTYESSSWGERGFCRKCGSALFFRTKDQSFYGIAAMAFDELTDAELADQIFIDSKPAWYAFANDTKTLTGAEFLAQFTPDQDGQNG